VGQSPQIGVKALALSVLAANRRVPHGGCVETLPALGQKQDKLAACASPACAGCYDVGDGRKLHPPKSSPEWLAWLERWQPRGKLQ
jgi:hypothetical protein